MTKKITIVFLMLLASSSNAYPIAPCPLRRLIEKSQYIVFANVVDIVARPNDKWYDHKAILVIKEIYQGNVPKDTIEVYFSRTMACPIPDKYEKGTSVLAFLYKEKENNYYQTESFSYGSKEMNPASIAVYKSRILEMQEINKIKDANVKNAQTMDWLIRCATNPYTRWEGVYELEPKSGFMAYYDKGKDTLVSMNHLSENQLATLRQSLFTIDTLDHDALELANIVEKKNDTELLNFLITKLKQDKLKGWRIKEYMMQEIAQVSGRADLKAVYSKINDLGLNYPNHTYEEMFPQFSKEFMDLL